MPAIPASGPPVVSVIIPARNEEANLGACLRSLASQTGVAYEIIVVDDHSDDRTAEIARSFSGVQILAAPDLPPGWTGKNNAVAAGAAVARGEWLLFTDADTVHLPGSLGASVEEAEREQATLLSYSPEQIVETFWEKAVMPAIFAELAATFRPREVSDPASPAAAANGQFILVRKDVYNAVGGHTAIAGELLEDVALARAVKRAGNKIFFRYGGDQVRTRMYRSFDQMREGWTKNLALLFPSPRNLAALRFLEFTFVIAGLTLTVIGIVQMRPLLAVLGVLPAMISFARLQLAHFSAGATALSIFGLPMFSYLLVRSQRLHAQRRVTWKGREYSGQGTEVNPGPQLGV
jgi:glycosyltransferase involved in cell wall biosynthesis